MVFRSLFNNILKVDPKIRFVTICDLHGRINQTGHRKGIRNILDHDESVRALNHAAKAWNLRNEVSHKIGKGKYALVVYEKIKRITIPLGNEHIIYMTVDSNANHSKIIDETINLIKNNR